MPTRADLFKQTGEAYGPKPSLYPRMEAETEPPNLG